MIEHGDVDGFRRVLDVENGIDVPSDAGDIFVVEFHFFHHRAAGGLHHLRLQCLPQLIGRAHLAAIVCDIKTPRPDFASSAIDFNIRHHRHARAAAHGLRKTLPDIHIATHLLTCADLRLPVGFFRDGFHHCEITLVT